ncbi:hypothetical protein FTW19_17680 [Terriglobus albidus]|uniref:Ricin B lectin domain-containing protein n=1 Tax=Terriglobus albidus TaxID=1592106 RepID=A0A5B9EEV9_9BACT|nr:RICIN domain-containing protein [Terriglobus albidus]QEE29655.1 hypothetical protein FTW19_17680 [Terriglobus albidus]
MNLEGVVSELVTGTVSIFTLRTKEGAQTHVQAEHVPPGLKNGDTVRITGHNPPDPPFVADSVVRLTVPSSSKWKWITAGAAVCLVVALMLLLRAPEQSRRQVPDDTVISTQPVVPPQEVKHAVPAPSPSDPVAVPTPLTPPAGIASIMNVNSTLCLSPAGGTNNLNEQVVQFVCDKDAARVWRFSIIDGDIVKIINGKSGLCLTIAGGRADINAPAVQYTCDGDPSRRWRFAAIDAKTFRLVNLHSNLCLTIAGGDSSLNMTAVQYACDADPSRTWRIAP